MFTVYILQSVRTGRYYVGHSADFDSRLHAHNAGKVRSTKAYAPWKVIYREEYAAREEAYRREHEIKSYKSGAAFQELIWKSGGW